MELTINNIRTMTTVVLDHKWNYNVTYKTDKETYYPKGYKNFFLDIWDSKKKFLKRLFLLENYGVDTDSQILRKLELEGRNREFLTIAIDFDLKVFILTKETDPKTYSSILCIDHFGYIYDIDEMRPPSVSNIGDYYLLFKGVKRPFRIHYPDWLTEKILTRDEGWNYIRQKFGFILFPDKMTLYAFRSF